MPKYLIKQTVFAVAEIEADDEDEATGEFYDLFGSHMNDQTGDLLIEEIEGQCGVTITKLE